MPEPKDQAKQKTVGPVEDRTCTDILCCIIFSLAIIGLIITAAISFATNNIGMLTSPFDSSDHACGQSYNYSGTVIDLKSKPYLYFSTPYVTNNKNLRSSALP